MHKHVEHVKQKLQMRVRWLLVFVGVLLLTVSGVQGQDEVAEGGRDLSQVYVTTQDYAALRAGPGTIWDRLAVLPYGATFHATGRTIDGRWLQLAYDGPLDDGARTDFTVDGVTYGWVADWLLEWTGDMLQLPIDGVQTVPTARLAGPTMVLSPTEYMYVGSVDPSTRVTPPISSAVRVEVTGRLGSADGGAFWIQFKLGGKYYWTASWAVGVPGGYEQTPDASSLYAYGYLLTRVRVEIGRTAEVLGDIGGRWRALDAGQTTTCNAIPEDFALRENSFLSGNLSSEPIFVPLADAMQNAAISVNAALAKFRKVCDDANRLVDPAQISAALADIDNAERNLTVARTLIAPLQSRDPILKNEPAPDASTAEEGTVTP
jgi:hypothetical protein